MRKTVDFTALCLDFGIPTRESGHHHCHEGWIQVNCPFCGDGSEGWHLGYSIHYGNMNCWRCGSHSLYEFLSTIRAFQGHSISFRGVMEQYGQFSLQKASFTSSARLRQARAPQGLIDSPTGAHAKYLKRRGFDPKELHDQWNLRYTRLAPYGWGWRVVAPIHDVAGNTVAWTGRSIQADVKPKWKTSSHDEMSVNPRSVLYGIDKAQDTVVIVEGPGDAWKIGAGAVATLGIDWTLEQANILRCFKNRWVMFDPEPVAQKRSRELADWLGGYGGNTSIIDDLISDPGDMNDESVRRVREIVGLENQEKQVHFS